MKINILISIILSKKLESKSFALKLQLEYFELSILRNKIILMKNHLIDKCELLCILIIVQQLSWIELGLENVIILGDVLRILIQNVYHVLNSLKFLSSLAV